MAKSKKDFKAVLSELGKQLSGTYSVKLVLSDQDSIDKLGWLKDGQRDFLKVTPQLEKNASTALVKSLKKADLSNPQKAATDALAATGEAIHEHIATRFQGAKRDVRMRPLSPGWIRHKGHNRIGIYTGDLFKDILNGNVTIKRVK